MARTTSLVLIAEKKFSEREESKWRKSTLIGEERNALEHIRAPLAANVCGLQSGATNGRSASKSSILKLIKETLILILI